MATAPTIDNRRIFPLGDQAAMVYSADETTAARLAAAARRANPDWLIDVVSAYASVAVYFDALEIKYDVVADWLNCLQIDGKAETTVARLVTIPCCYEIGPDLPEVAQRTGLSQSEVIELHSSVEYVVYAIGFCPGFPYLGYVPEKLAGLPRRSSPRPRVEPGSVGVTGRQTGIYPLPRPGGWHLIGRTPMKLVDLSQGLFALSPGDRVRFQPISTVEWRDLRGA